MGGCPHLDDVYRGVQIPQVMTLTLRTPPRAVPQCDCIIHVTAGVTRLRARIPAGDERNMFFTLARNLFDDGKELTERQIGNLSPPEFFHGGNVQILEKVPVKRLDKSTRKFPKVVFTLPRNLSVSTCHFDAALTAMMTAELTARQPAISVCDILQ